MISLEKVLRAVELIRRYCGERGCSDCAFQSDAGFCRIQSAKTPENFAFDDLHGKEEKREG